jgi:hypothetical protein
MPTLGHLTNFFNSWNTTAFLAVWGALLSTATAGWTLYKDLRDKAKIMLAARLRCIGQREGDGAYYMADPGMNLAGMRDELFIVVSVTNIGRRRMRWKGWGGKYRKPVNGKNTFIVSARFLPKILEEQESLDEWAALDKEFVTENVEQLCVWDGEGREWSVSKNDMTKLAADIKKYAKAPQ